MFTIAVLISGSGTNLQALIDNQKHYDIGLVVSSRASVAGLDKAYKAGILDVRVHSLNDYKQAGKSR